MVGADKDTCRETTIAADDRLYYKSAYIVTSSTLVHYVSLTPNRDNGVEQKLIVPREGAGYQRTDFAFTADEDLIGFYGKKSATGITQLGFIVRDN